MEYNFKNKIAGCFLGACMLSSPAYSRDIFSRYTPEDVSKSFQMVSSDLEREESREFNYNFSNCIFSQRCGLEKGKLEFKLDDLKKAGINFENGMVLYYLINF